MFTPAGGWQASRTPLTNRELDHMLALLCAVRDAVGPYVDLAVDCHWNYNVRDAIRMAQAFAPLRLCLAGRPHPTG
jgi:L-alanine-DL-glutamate epimerase-like enolase superfamily enzyme